MRVAQWCALALAIALHTPPGTSITQNKLVDWRVRHLSRPHKPWHTQSPRAHRATLHPQKTLNKRFSLTTNGSEGQAPQNSNPLPSVHHQGPSRPSKGGKLKPKTESAKLKRKKRTACHGTRAPTHFPLLFTHPHTSPPPPHTSAVHPLASATHARRAQFQWYIYARSATAVPV